MASEQKEIGEIAKKCKILLLDIEGTTTSISFVKDKLFPYAEENVKKFLEEQWETDDVKEVVVALRKQSVEDKENGVEGLVAVPGEDATKDEQIEGIVGNVKWQMGADRKAGPLKQLQGLIWKQGYDNGDIKGHVYDDVAPALEQWRAVDGQKVYIYSSGSVQAQKLLFGQSEAGDLLKHIDGHFDTAVGAKQEAASYTNIVEKIGCKAEDVLFLTDIPKEAEAANTAGLSAVLVSRPGNAPLPDDTKVLRSFAELAPSHKRKQDTPEQDEQPAKIPKTDNEEKETVPEAKEPVTDKVEETEKMEVEDAPVVESSSNGKEAATVTVEEITDSNEATGVPVVDVEPVIEEKETKTDEKQTEKMDAEESKIDETKTAEAVITEIEDISDKHVDAEVIEGIEPVVEEPAAEDIENLQNAGDELEKECDEILSKVQGVTNLDSMPVKPILKPIAEETMETDNLDSNDIVDKILDTELELEMKEIAGKDNIVPDVAGDAKIEENGVKEGNGTKEEVAVAAEIVTDKEAKSVPEEKVEASSSDTKDTVTDKPQTTEETEAPVTSTSEPETATEVKVEEPTAEVTEEKVEQVEETKEVTEPHVNGNANGDTESVKLNGDAKDDELNSRLSVENGNGDVNGSANGTANGAVEDEQGQGDSKVEPETEIKVKTVTTDEVSTNPTEQPTEA